MFPIIKPVMTELRFSASAVAGERSLVQRLWMLSSGKKNPKAPKTGIGDEQSDASSSQSQRSAAQLVA